MEMMLTRQEGYQSEADSGQRVDFKLTVTETATDLKKYFAPLWEDMEPFWPEANQAHDPGYFLQDYVYAYDYELTPNKDGKYEITMKSFPALGGSIGGEQYMLPCDKLPPFLKREKKLIFSPFNDHLAADPFEAPWFYPPSKDGVTKTKAIEGATLTGIYGTYKS
jgi:hypothetical protein